MYLTVGATGTPSLTPPNVLLPRHAHQLHGAVGDPDEINGPGAESNRRQRAGVGAHGGRSERGAAVCV